MGSQTKCNEIPSIDFSEETLKQSGSDSWNLACKQARCALEEYGCFEIHGCEVPTQLHDSIFASAKELFELPVETKKQRTTSRPSPDYISQIPGSPLYESLVINTPTTFKGVESFTKIMWPNGNDFFHDSVASFSKVALGVYEIATRIIFESYGVGKHHESHMESVTNYLRFFKYRAPEPEETNTGLKAHIDKTFITLIYQHQAEGLQMKTKDDQYVDIKPKPSSFLLIAGDGLQAWSNDQVRGCEHRVMIQKERYSLGFITMVKGLLCVPEELVDEQHPLLYKPFDQIEYLAAFFGDKATKKVPCHIKAYAGIN